REVKDAYRIKKINEKAIKIRPKRITQDRRKKEWFLFKKNNELQLGKVIRKTEKIIVAEHWKKGPIQEPESETFTRCKSCNGKNFYNSTCVISIKYNDWHQIVDITKERENIKLKAPISVYIEER